MQFQLPTWQNKTFRLISYSLLLVLTLELFRRIFLFLRDGDPSEWILFSLSLVWGVGGIWLIFFLANQIVEQLPEKYKKHIVPWLFVGPALIFLFYYLVIPTFRSLYISFFDKRSEKFVGLDNYIFAFTSDVMLEAFRNNIYWLVFGAGLSVLFGLIVAVLSDKTHPIFEVSIKTLIFLPMAISMIGASVIWRFVYAFSPAGSEQIGILNAIAVALGNNPVPWLLLKPLNTFLLIAIVVWMQAGYAMVIFSAAVKAVPAEFYEAARIDGASEWQSFFRITLPSIQGTLIAVTTTVIAFTLKAFDIVLGMTGGNFGTEVIANQQYSQMFRSFHFGRGAAIAIVLLIIIVPIVYYNVRDFNKTSEAL